MRIGMTTCLLFAAIATAGCTDKTVYEWVEPAILVTQPDTLIGHNVQTITHVKEAYHKEWTTFIIICRGKGGCSVIPQHHEETEYNIYAGTNETDPYFTYRTTAWGHDPGSWQGTVKAKVVFDADGHFLWWKTKGDGVIRQIKHLDPL